MPTYTFRFERYVQFSQDHEIEAESLEEAIEAARSIKIDVDDDPNDPMALFSDCWVEEWNESATHPRLYNVKDEAGTELAHVDIPFPTRDWWKECLLNQWGRDKAQTPAFNEIQDACFDTSAVWNRLAPVITDEGVAELARCRMEKSTAPALGSRKQGRI